MNTLPEDFTILALETSCDETAAAVVRGGRTMLANVVASQMEVHQRFGGIVPEVASRQHMLSLVPVVNEALRAVPGGWQGIHAIAATHGPGLSGALLTGLNAAKAMAWQRNLPFIPVNHLEAHIYASWIRMDEMPAEEPAPTAQAERKLKSLKRPTDPAAAPPFPLVALVVSGGHTLLALLRDHGDYQLLGQTRDDAVGEAFDKVARILGLGYPGGPAIQQVALGATPSGVLPRAWLRDSFDFSFSGLKTAVLHKVQERQDLSGRLPRPGGSERRQGGRTAPPAPNVPAPAPDSAKPASASLDSTFVAQMAHAFQESVVDVLTAKAVDAAVRHNAAAIILAGGVAANLRLREELTRRANVPVRCPPLALCTDNAAMVAAAAFYRYDASRSDVWATDVHPSLALGG
ncbi:MAG: tRNA (adenosine(37)-N6)-threonylcarbamoyltransferase complex transferase subunit TsaD [Candidatus Viridilinea halotolerans]|uniref:tRNA N6-adenosine threonylcarbamoyltransferase n=1 Tax=Candidatus Viridilinea halotolerans TaxID=2491704 RepID=A0A426UBC3_9CHLR|nr:MAG: tRNA (adenosine(37)-N6)-threonylcarbamoyltransferase complex transferase subunit TsaD [Candidatus Viridilinea halotolerans]